MKIQTKLKPFRLLEKFFPIWSLKRQSKIVYQAFDSDLKAAYKSEKDHNIIETQMLVEIEIYEDKIASIRSRRLINEAENRFIYLPDLKWEQGNFGDTYLDKASLSNLFHAMKEQRDKANEYRLKLAGSLTGIIGALIGLLAVWKK